MKSTLDAKEELTMAVQTLLSQVAALQGSSGVVTDQDDVLIGHIEAAAQEVAAKLGALNAPKGKRVARGKKRSAKARTLKPLGQSAARKGKRK